MNEKELLRQIESGAIEVRATGDELTKRIKAYEGWLSALPGRVPASCVLSTDEDGFYEKLLSLEKDGKAWALYVFTYDNRDDSASDRMPLRDASIDTKTWALQKFPDLLKAIAKRQKSLVESARSSISEFDAFATAIGLNKEGA